MSNSKRVNSNINFDNFFPSVLIILFLVVGFIPNLGAVDKIAPQWVYLSCINIFSGLFLLYKRDQFLKPILNTISSKISIFYIIFFIWASMSYFYAINKIEVLVNIARQSNTLFMYLHLAIFVYNIKQKNNFISWLMSSILAFEVYSVFSEALTMIEVSGFISPGSLKGVTANRNITAFSIALKIPFVLYLMNKLKNKLLLFLLMIIIFIALLDISMISSRASFIAVAIILFGYIFICFFKFKFFKEKESLVNTTFSLGYYFIPLIFAIFINQIYFSSRGADAISRAGTIAINTTDDSISKRLRYYEDVMNHMISNPILGTGIGNWKLESINYDKLDIDGYIVPYHAHSDFIQLGAELGFIGFFLYLGIFITAIYFVIKIFFKSKLSQDNKVFSVFLLISLGVYLIDANLNFPIARPQELAPWAMVMALISFYFGKTRSINESNKENNFDKLKYIFPALIILCSIPAFSISNQTYESHKAQLIILNDFNNNLHSVPLDKIESFVPSIPNITVTTIPMDAIKARYYVHYKKYNKALGLIKSSKFQNPYLSYSDALESVVHNIQQNYPAAKSASEKAFYNLPKNNFHISQYMNSLMRLKDEESLEKAFKLLTRNDNTVGWKNYLATISNIADPGNPVYMKRAKKATELFPEDTDIRIFYKYISIGKDYVEYANEISAKAMEKFNLKLYKEASSLYDEAIFYDPYEYSYYENASISYYSIQDYDKSLLRINEVISNMNPLNGKCEYIKGLNYLQLGLIQDACDLFKTSAASGFSESQNLLNQYCSK